MSLPDLDVALDVRIEDGYCLMRGRGRLFAVVMAAEPDRDHPLRTHYAHVEAVPRRGTSILRHLMARIVADDVRGFGRYLEAGRLRQLDLHMALIPSTSRKLRSSIGHIPPSTRVIEPDRNAGDVTMQDEENTMRVFVAGASGAIGTRLVPQLVERGHEVVGTFMSPANAGHLRTLGAQPIALDLLNARAVREAVLQHEPEAIVHQATALADVRFSRSLDRTFAQTNRLRTEGTDALLAAAREAGVRRFVAQSFANLRYERECGPVKTETDPLDPNPVPATRKTNAAMRHLDQAVTDAGGIALRYGSFYGASNDALLEPVRKRQFPIVGDGGGVSSFIHLDDAAEATVLALEHDGTGIFHIVDDEPAEVREWLPALADVLGAKPPRHVPRWLARLFAGEAAVMMGTESRGATNAKAKRELGWRLQHPTWREGFVAAYASATDGHTST